MNKKTKCAIGKNCVYGDSSGFCNDLEANSDYSDAECFPDNFAKLLSNSDEDLNEDNKVLSEEVLTALENSRVEDDAAEEWARTAEILSMVPLLIAEIRQLRELNKSQGRESTLRHYLLMDCLNWLELDTETNTRKKVKKRIEQRMAEIEYSQISSKLNRLHYSS
ncbi:hypothetical protein LCGC14_0145750 [marine sediment metagenome]|uniref:Uncharacterized protein n=1 Tax=marine sediment metagenome TaxID=412755 RepID=A0A0F9V3A9_9ZZZZ